MSVETIMQDCRDLLELLPAQALSKAQQRYPHVGGLAVFPVYAPLEIIHAAGLMPVGLFGAGDKVELSHADARFQSFICSIAKSTLELFLRGEMKAFAGVVFSSICDVARNLASLVRRNAPELYVEYLHLPQNMYSAASQDYTRAEFERFRTNLARHLGRSIPDAAVARSLELYNQVRARTRELYELRRARPGVISAADTYAVVQAGTRMMPEEFAELLEDLLFNLRQRTGRARDGVQVVLEGAFCEQPPLALVETIEAAGCIIQDDDLVVGWRLFSDDVPVHDDPLGALAQAYLRDSVYTSVRHDRDRPRTEGLTRRVERAGAGAVLFTPAKFCEPALLDYVLFRQRLDETGCPHLKIEFEEKMWTFEATRTEVETFAESMLFD
ncbi:MAG: 2-hydroxyacyl-CoA dehydratase [Planctomycetes bacterium]|nr:2-hydroxyacyl-CoA dehydratase [Planctomycetota bacterium]